MIWIIVIIIFFLLLGPLRRHAFGRHGITLTLPALLGGGIGLWYGLRAQAQGVGIPHLPLICMVFGAMMLGGAVKAGLDDIIRNWKGKDQ